MSTVYTPFIQRIGGDGSLEGHSYELTPLPSSVHISRTPELSEVEALKAKLTVKELELAAQKDLNARTKESLRIATSIFQRALTRILAVKKAQNNLKRKLSAERAAHTATRAAHDDVKRKLKVERRAHAVTQAAQGSLKSELRAERVAHNTTRAEFGALAECAWATNRATLLLATPREVTETDVAALRTTFKLVTHRVRELVAARETEEALVGRKNVAEVTSLSHEAARMALDLQNVRMQLRECLPRQPGSPE